MNIHEKIYILTITKNPEFYHIVFNVQCFWASEKMKVHYANQPFIDDQAEMWPCLRKENRQLIAFCIVCCSEFTVALLKSKLFCKQ